jgi:hypothetical protein
MTGFLDAVTRPQAPSSITVDDPDKVMAVAVTALLGPEDPGQTDVSAAAEEGLRLLRELRDTVLVARPEQLSWPETSASVTRAFLPHQDPDGRLSVRPARNGRARDGCLTGRFVHGSAAPPDGSSAGGRGLDGEDRLRAKTPAPPRTVSTACSSSAPRRPWPPRSSAGALRSPAYAATNTAATWTAPATDAGETWP